MQNNESVPYIVFEGEQARNERHIKRLWIALIIAIILIMFSNVLWLLAWMQYDYDSSEVLVSNDGGGNANYIGKNGDISNGIRKSKNENETEEEWSVTWDED